MGFWEGGEGGREFWGVHLELCVMSLLFKV